MARYRIYANYVFSKVLGEYEADSEEEAVETALDEAPDDAVLCVHCSKDFVDSGILDEKSCTADLIEKRLL